MKQFHLVDNEIVQIFFFVCSLATDKLGFFAFISFAISAISSKIPMIICVTYFFPPCSLPETFRNAMLKTIAHFFLFRKFLNVAARKLGKKFPPEFRFNSQVGCFFLNRANLNLGVHSIQILCIVFSSYFIFDNGQI